MLTFITKKEFWNYSVFTSITYFLSEWVMMTDHFMVSLFFDESSLASYRIASLIPFNLLFLSKVFIQTDFPKLAKNYLNKAFLLNYYFNYLKLFIPIALLILIVGYFTQDYILSFFFGNQYHEGQLFFLLLFYTFIAMLFFVPLGSILVAVGKVKQNSKIAVVNLITLSSLSYLLIPYFQLSAIPIAVISSFLVSSLMSIYFFMKYIKSLKNN